jgi:hypothetical protein
MYATRRKDKKQVSVSVAVIALRISNNETQNARLTKREQTQLSESPRHSPIFKQGKKDTCKLQKARDLKPSVEFASPTQSDLG